MQSHHNCHAQEDSKTKNPPSTSNRNLAWVQKNIMPLNIGILCESMPFLTKASTNNPSALWFKAKKKDWFKQQLCNSTSVDAPNDLYFTTT